MITFLGVGVLNKKTSEQARIQLITCWMVVGNVTNAPKKTRRKAGFKRNRRIKLHEAVKRGTGSTNSRGKAIEQMHRGKNGFILKILRHIHVKEKIAGSIKEMTEFPLSDTVLLGGIRTGGFMDYTVVWKKWVKEALLERK